MRGSASVAIVLSGFAWMGAAVQAQVLTYTLSGPLKDGTGPSANSCRGDTDGDCLHNGREDELAAKVNPRIYYDESEECASGIYTPRIYYQVRPGGPSGTGAGQVRQWSAGDLGVEHYVSVTYFILFIYDCGSACSEGAGCGHQGDSESVRFFLKSTDLVTWTLMLAEYNHHSTASGEYLVNGNLMQQMSFEGHPIIAADEDSHGSWPGKSRSSDNCAADMSGCFGGSVLGACDCFDRGSMSSSTGYFVPLQGTYTATRR